MSRRDDEQGGYPTGDSRWRRDDSFADPSHPPSDTAPLDPVSSEIEAQHAPVDLAAVQADDALLNMLGSGAEPAPEGTDAELARILSAWRREVDAEPFGDLVDPATATTVLAAARRPARRRHPVLAPFAAAAAVLVIAFSGVGLAAKSAEPGDQLWSLTKVLYTDYARSVEAAEQVKAELAEADTALKQGDTSQAKESLERIEQQLAEVNDPQDRTELAAQYRQMETRLQQSDQTAADGPPTTEPEPPVTALSPAAEPPAATSAPPPPPQPPPATSTTTPSTVPSTLDEPPPPPSETRDAEPRSSEPTPEVSSEVNSTTTSPPPG